MSVKAYSAPGKALIAGGYLVLDPLYNSYVTALSARMHAVVQNGPSSDHSQITVKSPQFQGEWVYDIGTDHSTIEAASASNPFLAATVSTVLGYVQPSSKFNIVVTIYSDPGFHSQENTTAVESANKHKRFLYHQQAIHEVPKTGLGLSAGLVSVVCAALLGHFGDFSQNVIHNTAQIAHCIAQKKIGSGFDVAAAVYGSIMYRRFEPSLISLAVGGNRDGLTHLIDSDWNFNHAPCTLPPHVRILMGDIQGGSETPKLVSKVLQWRADQPQESLAIYTALNQANQDLMDSLAALHHHHSANEHEYMAAINYLHNKSIASVELYLGLQPALKTTLAPFLAVTDAISRIRSNLRKMTRACGAEIEPIPQTKLLNDCGTLRGCLGGVVPGAGGYDAISLLVIDSSIESIVECTSTDARFSRVAWLDLHEQKSGLVQERSEDYQGLD
ncbi:Phosphomevalonate kinase [Suhomyces tanzawaensis NRRL Y-17324]|uniref:Phosphomevalonate kinase n=1 Tax=Suhomyces tanzawaensis NRRL Y-17324 TaxID=984487 RepID=A0A1E4SLT5_9ASCO|nr:Phosphomevalonate kinase [Suhomyces tanzawaensis NRRL Y-17324]ODV80486.1 Phosphomevalonate kinase [Suhomyces tanzawaensis NRRL Y-17324]